MSDQLYKKYQYQLRFANCYTDAKKILNIMKSLKINLNRIDYLYLKSKAKTEEEIGDVIKEIQDAGFNDIIMQTEKDYFNKLLSKCVTFEDTLHLISKMKNYGIKPIKYYYMVLLRKAESKEQEEIALTTMLKLGMDLKNSGVKIIRYSNLLARSSNFKESVKIIAEMQKKGINIDKFCRVAFLKKASTNQEREYAKSLLSLNAFKTGNFNKENVNLTKEILTQYNTKSVTENIVKPILYETHNKNDIKDKKINISTRQENFTVEEDTIQKNNEKINKNLRFKNLTETLHPLKKNVNVNVTERNQTIIKYLKDLYKDTCQICGEKIEIDKGIFYSEVHHIQPLGEHKGPDIIENMIVLCPNHHSMFDKGAITIDLKRKLVIHKNPDNPINGKSITIKHRINDKYISYHNKNIFSKQLIKNNRLKSIYIPVRVKDKIFYGDLVFLEDIKTGEKAEIKIENYYNREFMLEIQKKLLYKCINDCIENNGFKYIILSFQT